MKKYPNDVDIKMFKFADDIIRAIIENKPHILALSNLGWNVNLNKAVIKIAKENNPDVLVVFGRSQYTK